jgi:hypothetical protein
MRRPPVSKGRTGQRPRGPYWRRPPPPEEGKARLRASGGRFEAPCPPKSTRKVFKGRGIVKRNPKGVGVKTDEFPHKNILEAEVVLKGRHDKDSWVLGKGVLDPMQRSVHANQPDGARMLSAKAKEKAMDRQPLRGKMMTKIRGEARRGGINQTTAPRPEEPTKDGSVFVFCFLDVISLRARGRKQGQCRPPARGRHLLLRAQTCWW